MDLNNPELSHKRQKGCISKAPIRVRVSESLHSSSSFMRGESTLREMNGSRPEYRRRYRAAIVWRERAFGDKSPRGNTPLGDETTMHRDYVGVYEKRTSK